MENKKKTEKIHMGEGVSRQIHKKKTEKSPILWKMGGGLTQSIKSWTEKVKEGGQENVEFIHIQSVFNLWLLP